MAVLKYFVYFICFHLAICDTSRKVTSTSTSPRSKCQLSKLAANCNLLNLADVPTDLPANITKLQMNSNLVTTLKKGAFKATPSLIYLSLSICKMSTIQDGAFQGLHNLNDLRLSNNKIRSLSDGVFTSDLGNLKILYMSQNYITKISQHVFDHLVKLEELHLDHNHLAFIHSHAFTKLTSIKLISVEFNILTTANPTWFTPVISSLKQLSLQNNRWTCDCRMIAFKNWTNTARRKFGSSLDIMCNSRKSLLKSLHTKDLICTNYTVITKTEGSPVTFNCPDTKTKTWNFMSKKKNITKFALITQTESLKMLPGHLTISGVTKPDTGTYCCTQNAYDDSEPAPDMNHHKRCFTLKVTTSHHSRNGSSASSSASAVVIVLTLLFIATAGGVWYFHRKRRNYGLLSDEAIFRPTLDDPTEASQIPYQNSSNPPNIGEAYV